MKLRSSVMTISELFAYFNLFTITESLNVYRRSEYGDKTHYIEFKRKDKEDEIKNKTQWRNISIS